MQPSLAEAPTYDNPPNPFLISSETGSPVPVEVVQPAQMPLQEMTQADVEAMNRRMLELANSNMGIPPELASPEAIEEHIAKTSTEAAIEQSATAPIEPAKARTCRITDHFGMNFVELMKAAPNNPLTRAHMLKVLKQMPPPEADKFFKLVDWVEFNFPRQLDRPKPKSTSTATFALDFSVTRTDIGRANYCINRRGTWAQTYNMDELREWIEENEDSFDDLESRFYQKARENESCDFEDSGSYEYSEHEDTGSDGTDLDIQGDSDDRFQDLINFLRSNGADDLADMLEDRQ